MTESTGSIPFRFGGETFETFYKAVGDVRSSSRRPLVVLHGGPGISHEYMLPHLDLFASYGIPVITYDQIGIGRSTRLPEKPDSFWTVDLFIAELENLLIHFGITESFDLLGHSWGGM
jgi:pimeloyl-ACP methyl ester carboxylesterase